MVDKQQQSTLKQIQAVLQPQGVTVSARAICETSERNEALQQESGGAHY